ncbi:helix-turn-helix domain-containing protein [Saccharothrix sp. NRRL B-16314]|uniref:helix-turn-helix domain-containing protein n=1 Tax=Saccharothrix sp. NRRL B-16314 TaxID=1463825 RepID=UPI0018CC5EDF
MASKDPGGSSCRLDQRRLDQLAEALERGPAAYGFGGDRRWTLARVSDLIARLFHTRYMLRGVSCLLHRMGFSPQVPLSVNSGPRAGDVAEVQAEPFGAASRLS